MRFRTGLLFDEDLSHKLPALLAPSFPGSLHVRECGLLGRSDEEVWEHAASKGYAIVSKDSDFQQRSLLLGFPPKVIWLRLGNCTRDDLIHLMNHHEQDIRAFLLSASESILILT